MLLLFPVGYLASFAFAPHDYFVALIIAMALLFSYAQGQASTKKRFLAGLLWGAGLHIPTAEWVYASMMTQDHSVPLAVAVCVVFNGWLGLSTGAFSALMPLFQSRFAGLSALGIAGLWTLSEWVKASVLQGFPWLGSGYAATDTPLSNIIPYLGVFGASFLLALSISLVLCWTLHWRRWQLLLNLALIWAVLWMLPIAPIKPTGDSLNIALVQGNIAQKQKWRSEQFEPSMDRYLSLSESVDADTDLIVWPESAITRYPQQVSTALTRQLQRLAQQKGATLISGQVIQSEQHLFNSVVDVSRSWQDWHYAKRHLVPFTESMPLQHWVVPVVRWVTGTEPLLFQPGRIKQPLLTVNQVPVGISICYELAFWAQVRTALPQAQVLINLSNEAWFYGTDETAQMTQIARVRALEAGRYVLKATNTGLTAVISPQGVIEAQLPENEPGVLVRSIPMMVGDTVFALWGNLWLYGLGLPLLGCLLFRQKQAL